MSERSIAQEQPARTDQSHRLWLVRHGATAWNLERRYQGQSDIPLAPLGRAQACWVGRRLRLEHIRAIYSSDLQRTRETATIIAQNCSFHQPITLSSAGKVSPTPRLLTSTNNISASLVTPLIIHPQVVNPSCSLSSGSGRHSHSLSKI